MTSFGLADLFSLLQLSTDDEANQMVSYDTIYPPNWAGDQRLETRHRDIARRIVEWPVMENQEVSRDNI